MECEQCGARRPPNGPCPYCGAPPGRSSLRDWTSRPGASNAGWGRGASGAGWGYGGGEGGGWGRGPEDEYEEVERGRALVPTGSMMPETGIALPGGVPGMPTEEEERLLGIRRPVYIPATDDRRGRRPGGWRVIAGILSIMLVCLASCGAATYFGHNFLTNLNKAGNLAGQRNAIDYSQVPQTPVATPGTAGTKYITSVTTAKRVDSGFHPVNITSKFQVNDTVYVVAEVRNAPQGQHNICVGWYLGGEYLQLPSSAQLCRNTDGNPNLSVYFSLNYPTAGVGMARIYWDRSASDTNTTGSDPTLAQTIYFGIYEPATPTSGPTTPSPHSSTPSTTPKSATPSPTKTGG